MKTRIIINPSAGAGRAAARVIDRRDRLRSIWGNLEWTESRTAQDVTRLAREAANAGYAQVLVAGGDGTVHYAANGLVGSNTNLGVLPVGTGNDIAASVGIPKDLDKALDLLAQHNVHHVDVGQAGDRYYCCVLGIGMDTDALHRINSSKMRRGRLLYTWAAIRTLCTYRPQFMSITCGDIQFQGRAFFAAITNTSTYAGGMKISPNAKVNDGRLDLCVVPEMGRTRLLASFGRIVNGHHQNMSGIVLHQGSVIEVKTSEPLPITLDGELTDITTSLKVRVLPGALRMLGRAHTKAAMPARRAA